MEAAIQTMVKVFLKSTKGKESLGKKEFQHLVKSQLSNILSVRKTPLTLSEMLLALCNQHSGLELTVAGFNLTRFSTQALWPSW